MGLLDELNLDTLPTTAAAGLAERTATNSATKNIPAASNVASRVSCEEKDVLAVLNPEGSFVDKIALACRISVSEALSSLTLLELKGLLQQFSGKRFAPR